MAMSDWTVRKVADELRPGDRFIFSDDLGGEGEIVTVEERSANMFGTIEVATEELDFTIDLLDRQMVTLAPPLPRWSNDSVPAKLAAGVNWWLNSDPDHAEDVVALTNDGQDALILSGLNDDVMYIVWVDPEGTVRTLKGQWNMAHIEEEE